jgi:hypothetical protein
MEVLLTTCHGGGAIKNVDLLPKGSNLLVLSQADKAVANHDLGSIFNSAESYQDHPEKFSLKHILKLYLFGMKYRNNIPELAVSGAAKEFDYTQFKQYLGRKLSDSQKNKILSDLKDYCSKSSEDDCKNIMIKAFVNIETANIIDDLKESESLSETYHNKTIFPHFFNQFPYTTNTDPAFIKKAFEKWVLSAPMTYFEACNQKYILDDDIFENCKSNPPPVPTFGVALAILYELHKSIQ